MSQNGQQFLKCNTAQPKALQNEKGIACSDAIVKGYNWSKKKAWLKISKETDKQVVTRLFFFIKATLRSRLNMTRCGSACTISLTYH